MVSSCEKSDNYMADAIITGVDMRACACCGGFMITFDGETHPYTGDYKLVDNNADLGVTSTDTFPIYVKVDWQPIPDKCSGNYIKITRIKRK
jgi:hypothetical protein